MSTFNGRFRSIPGISADRFDGLNRQSTVFFLSHCHTDHMIGLNHPDELPGPLYLSHVSALIVKQLFTADHFRKSCVVLEIGRKFDLFISFKFKMYILTMFYLVRRTNAD